MSSRCSSLPSQARLRPWQAVWREGVPNEKST
ncbi:hypothetical protein H310_15113 [Aphanomyces invadans]|uniref:Uncharacterized protein n=1 Tax=Aphanomyces invadans TaxID=157072 RepID=A0A024T9P6_9STRA|nr:hypothetical protein H310_15113 [Aphanomyces invadans]ETV90057.1 hypothetical protein H310_15113 [Aphanomyces invadans]|eukprot:XP_008881312.1 hypothetical protein H310_15113 [Aphanomyces invadans]